MEAYGEAICEIEYAGTWHSAVDLAAHLSRSFIVITACNPMSVRLPAHENEERTAELAALVGPQALRSVGRSADNTWHEPGFAVAPSDKALEIAAHFGQAAVYLVGPEGRSTIEIPEPPVVPIGEGQLP